MRIDGNVFFHGATGRDSLLFTMGIFIGGMVFFSLYGNMYIIERVFDKFWNILQWVYHCNMTCILYVMMSMMMMMM